MIDRPQTIGAYKILDVLGEGGMGVVYAAEQAEPVRRRVALKVIKLGMDTKEVLARFEAERQALALLDHPHIAKVLEAGATAEGRPYFAMELVRGVGITRYCDLEQATIAQRLALALQACSALQHAHDRGILHRDVKPSNMLVTEVDGAPVLKVIDFGLAKAVNQQLTERTLFTEAGRLIGTPEYMSPEQADLTSLQLDARADVYSLGVVLYELLAGALPFDSGRMRAGGFVEIQRVIKEEEPPTPSQRLSRLANGVEEIARLRNCRLRELAGSLRRGLDAVVMKALSKRRQDRYASCAELAADIQRFLRGEPVQARTVGAIGRWAGKVRRTWRRHAIWQALPIAIGIGVAVPFVHKVMVDAPPSQQSTSSQDDGDQKREAPGEETLTWVDRDEWRAKDPDSEAMQSRMRDGGDFTAARIQLFSGVGASADERLAKVRALQDAAMAAGLGDIAYHWVCSEESVYRGLATDIDPPEMPGVLSIAILCADRTDEARLIVSVRKILRIAAKEFGIRPDEVGVGPGNVDLIGRVLRQAMNRRPSLPTDGEPYAVVDVPRAASLLDPPIVARMEPMGPINMVTIHHNAILAPETLRKSLGQMMAMQENDFRRGYGDMGYHFCVDVLGNIHEARSVQYQGAHARGENNQGNIGICLLGNFVSGPRGNKLMPEQAAGLARLLDFLRAKHGIPPDACVGHGELLDTECPGRPVLDWLKAYRQQAAAPQGK